MIMRRRLFGAHRRSTMFGNKRGEIALTFTVASLLLMVVGSIFGLGVNKSQDVRTQAAGAVCGKSCASNGDCGTDTTTGTLTTCDLAIKKCIAVRDPKNPPCNATGPNSLGQCNESCTKNEQCNGTDNATGITLACDLSSKTCQQKYVNDPRQCPGYVKPTPRTNSGTTSGSEGAFKSSQYACGVGFRVVVDPLISRITLTGRGGTYDIGVADVVDPASSGFTGPTTPQEYRMWKPAATDTADNLLIEWNPATTYGTSGVPKGALHVRVRSGNSSNPNSKVNPQIDFYYFRNVPAWLKDGSPVSVSFSYYTLSGAQSKPVRTDATINATSFSCPGIVTTDTPTLPLEPTIARIVTPRNTVVPTRISTVVPTRGSTVPPTRVPPTAPQSTPTTPPTRVPSRTATPTPPACSTDITFLLDVSQTTQDVFLEYKDGIVEAIKEYGKDPTHANDKIQLYTKYFATKVHPISGPYSPKTFTFPAQSGLQWTNIKEALESINGNTIFITDGLPSVVQYGSNPSNFCVYPDGDLMKGRANRPAAGCDPEEIKRLDNIGYRSTGCGASCVAGGEKYSDARRDSMVTRNKDTTYGIFVNTGLYADSDFLADVSKDVIDVSNVAQTIAQIFDDACGRGNGISGNSRNSGTSSRGGAGSPVRSLTSTFVINNNSTQKTVESVAVKACDAAGNNCQTYPNPIRIEAGSIGRFSQTVPADVPAQNRALLTCDINYSDGTSLACPQKATNDDGIRFELSVVDEEVTGDSVSFQKAADVNKDGQVRANDYALCLVGNKLCDIIADEDNEVNALDRSVVYERLVLTTQ